MYSGHDFTSARQNDPRTNVRSKSNTTAGAETMTSFEAMPAAQASAAQPSQTTRDLLVSAAQ